MKDKITYFLNAVYYCMWLNSVRYGGSVFKVIKKSVICCAKLVCTEEQVERIYIYMTKRERQSYKFLHDRENGFYINRAKYEFVTLSACYSLPLSFAILGFLLRAGIDTSKIGGIVILAVPIGLIDIIANKSVYAGDRYLKYFKKFENKSDEWHHRWSRITTAFCIGAIIVVILSIAIMWAVLLL